MKTVQQKDSMPQKEEEDILQYPYFLAGVKCKFVSFQLFTAVIVEIVAFCVVTSCCIVGGYQHFGELY
jgi:hypothetical protein